VCFHAQQCAEKYLKAVLHEWGIAFPKTHDLEALVQRCGTMEPKFTALLAAAKVLASHAVEVRYPGIWATRADAEDALRTARRVRRLARQVLRLTPHRPVKKKAVSQRKRKRS
jgi:HEPN domain-containing protein